MNISHSPHMAFWRIGVLLACFMVAAAVAGENTGCETISATQVGAIVGIPMKGGVSRRSEGDLAQHCSFAGGDIRVDVSVLHVDSEYAAARSYKSALQQRNGDPSRDEPLHGVGTESRYRTTAKGTAIIARFGVHVVVVMTNAGRETVVGLVRAIGAKVTSDGHKEKR